MACGLDITIWMVTLFHRDRWYGDFEPALSYALSSVELFLIGRHPWG